MTFANCLDPDQGRQSVGPDLDPKHLIERIFFGKVNFEKSQQPTKNTIKK